MNLSLPRQTNKIQNDEKKISRNHNDDFNSWIVFFQIQCQ